MNIPAVCDNCGAFFPSGFAASGQITLARNAAGPCPQCGAMGRVPDGVFNVVGDTLEILHAPQQTLDDLRRLTDVLSRLRSQAASREEVATALREESVAFAGLLDLLPQNRSDLYAFISMLLAAAALVVAMRQGGAQTTSITIEQVIQKIFVAPEPTQSQPMRSADTVGRNERCPCGSGLKFKKCHGK